MIVTNAGKAGVNSSDQVTIDNVVFSDFRLNNISDYEQQQITAIQGTNTISANPTVALLSNGHALVQASVAANFNVNSVFIMAKGNSSEFLLALTDSDGSLSEEINIDAIRRLTFNATANNLVMKSDVSSIVVSAVAALPNDMPSYASDAYNRANDYTNSYVDNKLNTKADATQLSNYVTSESANDKFNAINSTVATKANITDLSSYANNDSVNSLSSKIDDVSNNAESSNDSISQANSIYFAQNDYDKAILTNKTTTTSKTVETIFNQLAADNAAMQSNIAANYASLKQYIDDKLSGK